MSKLQWYVNRLRAMNVREVAWRLDQKRIEKQEAHTYGKSKVGVGDNVFSQKLSKLQFHPEKLGLNFANTNYATNTQIHLLQGADYDRWTETFSYKLNYKQRDDLGDARTNWEKNRHFDWALLAKAYYVTRDERYLAKLQDNVDSWCNANPFLHGISWTSAMEFAIRSINWMVALAFIRQAGKDIPSLQNGSINITDYLTKHYSRFSSANNHLLVEATAIGLAGYAFDHQPWKELALRILSEELPKQNYPDGVNKELSLHYQTFGMEAYLLLARVAKISEGQEVSEVIQSWMPMLKKEAEFVAHSTWREQAVCEFGDDDEGKILDLQGGEWLQWDYVLQLASLITGNRYSDFSRSYENISWLFTEEEIDAIKEMPLYDASESRCFSEGGNSFLRDKEDRILIGIDHAELGFGSIAAHGHADALSLQMLVDGEAVLADPGTYIYHCDIEHRNAFRMTRNHNTLCLGGRDQSKMLGAFMWGDRAVCKLEEWTSTDEQDVLVASHDGYKPIIHRRKLEFDKQNRVLQISDTLSESSDYFITFMLGASVRPEQQPDGTILLHTATASIELRFENAERICIEDAELSPEYGVKVPTHAIRAYGTQPTIKTIIKINI